MVSDMETVANDVVDTVQDDKLMESDIDDEIYERENFVQIWISNT